MEKKEFRFRHLFLYAKYWYERKDLIKDLQIIFGHMCYLRPEHVTQRNIIDLMVEAAKFTDDYNRNNSFKEFLVSLLENSDSTFTGFHCSQEILHLSLFEKMVRGLMSWISLTTCVNKDGIAIFDLGEPDPNLLPLSSTRRELRMIEDAVEEAFKEEMEYLQTRKEEMEEAAYREEMEIWRMKEKWNEEDES